MFLFFLAYGGIWQTLFILVLFWLVLFQEIFFFLPNIALQKKYKK
jgi:hypothetical protein